MSKSHWFKNARRVYEDELIPSMAFWAFRLFNLCFAHNYHKLCLHADNLSY